MNRLVLIATELEARRLPALASAPRVLVCGLGPVSAALEVAAQLAVAPADEVLLLGLSGTRDPERAAPGAVFTGSIAINEAVGVGDGESFLDLSGMGIPSEGVAPDRVELSAPRGLDGLPSVPLGTVATASADEAHAAARARRRPEVVLEDMESWAVALACARFETPLCVLRAVSNRAGDRDTAGWCFTEAFAALDAALARWLAVTGDDS